MKKKHQRGFWADYFGTKSAYYFPCPGCGENLMFLRNNQTISVNCETKGKVRVPNMLKYTGGSSGCDNPLCPWSKFVNKYSNIGHAVIKGPMFEKRTVLIKGRYK